MASGDEIGEAKMFTFRHELIIRRSPEEVLALLTRFEDIPKFVPQVASAEQTTPGEVGVGTIFVQRGRFLGRTVETPTAVTVFEPPSRFAYRAERGPFPYEARYELTSRNAGTVLAADVTLRLRGLARVLEPLLGQYLGRVYSRNLDRMRELLER